MIEIIYCGNDKIFEGIFLSAESVARRTNCAVRFSIFTMNDTENNENYVAFSQEHADLIDKAVKAFNPENQVVRYDLTAEYKRVFGGGKNLKTMYTPYALLRLLAERVLDCDKAIYLDADTMACGDIAQLWNVDVDNHEYAAALDAMGKKWISKDYCNSGVLLLNLKKIRETGMFQKCRDMVKTKRMVLPDQTAIHKSAISRFYLDDKFNEQREIKSDTVIKHFNKCVKWLPFFHFCNVKQWQREEVRNTLGIRDFDEDYAFCDAYLSE